MQKQRPRGREDVMDAILAAATDRFAEQGPTATSVREIAARAGVNHGLVYRHFGAKDDLVAAVLNRLSDTLQERYDSGASAEEMEALADRHLRVVARTILDGYPVGRMQRNFPFVSDLVEQARVHVSGDTEARLAAGHAAALELGWRLFEPFLCAAAGLESLTTRDLHRAVRERGGRLLRDE